jgi:hypothetical protein
LVHIRANRKTCMGPVHDDLRPFALDNLRVKQRRIITVNFGSRRHLCVLLGDLT